MAAVATGRTMLGIPEDVIAATALAAVAALRTSGRSPCQLIPIKYKPILPSYYLFATFKLCQTTDSCAKIGFTRIRIRTKSISLH